VLPRNDRNEEKEPQMSERDRQLAEAIAQAVMARILDAAKSEEVAGHVLGNWGGQLDRIIGRALRRLGFYVLIGLIALGSVKLGFWEKFSELFKP
jgi:hypothetical protein